MRLADMPTHGDWVLLGEDPPHEIAFGVVGRFWAGETVWAQIDAADFEAFAELGFGKIARNFSLRSYGGDRTLVTYECRTLATDDTARRGFMRYWRRLAPFIGLVMRSQLRVIETETNGRYTERVHIRCAGSGPAGIKNSRSTGRGLPLLPTRRETLPRAAGEPQAPTSAVAGRSWLL